MSWKLFAWILGMGIIGKILYGIFGTQISIINHCSRKLFDMVKNEYDYWSPDSCDKYLKSVVQKNRIIVAVIFVVVILFAPFAGVLGFLLGYGLTLIASRKQVGVNKDNLTETISIFARFAKPDKQNEFVEKLCAVAETLNTETIYQAF